MSQGVEWFEEWFDTPYYHMLYSKHDLDEAMTFTKNLVSKIKLPIDARILDLGCGKGRHSIYLNQQGYSVVGLDLSCKSIASAKEFERPDLSFSQGDMRQEFGTEEYDLILNLFTSFGYFKTSEEHIPVLENVHRALKPGGRFVLDFFNSEVLRKDAGDHSLEMEGVKFTFSKRYESDRVVKQIHIIDGAEKHQFKEEVLTWSVSELRHLLESCGLKIINTYGSYLLDSFDHRNSERIIFCAQKS